MSWLDTIKQVAPTVATALGGPLAGAAVTALGGILGMSQPTQDNIAKVFADGQLTPDNLAAIRTLELQYQNDEKERGFKYAELQFKDTSSARDMQVATHSSTPTILTWIVVTLTLIAEGCLLFNAVPPAVDPIILGRILGTMDSALMLVLGFWFGSSHGSQQKTDIMAAAAALQQ